MGCNKYLIGNVTFQILYRWHIRSNVSVKELIQSLVGWHRNRCLDPEVWESFLRHQLDPALISAPSEVNVQTDKQDGQLPAEDKVSKITHMMSYQHVCRLK